MKYKRTAMRMRVNGWVLAGAALTGSFGTHAEVPCLIDTLEYLPDPTVINQGIAFGDSVAIDGDRIAVGAPGEGLGSLGAVYVFRRDNYRWVQEARLTEPDPTFEDALGRQVAMHGDRIVAGAPHPFIDDTTLGEAWVFRLVSGSWTVEASLIPSLASDRDFFGASVAIQNDLIVVGAPYVAPPENGRAFVFRWNGTQWLEEAALASTSIAERDNFGQSVALSGNRIAVGALGDYMGDGASGSVYVFKYNGSTWAQEARVRPNDDDEYRTFGNTVALLGDRLAVGAQFDNTLTFSNGAIYIFDWDGAAWVQQAKLLPLNPPGDFRLGRQVVLAPDQISATSGAFPTHPFTTHVYERIGANWEQRHLFAVGGGLALADDGSLIVIANRVMGLASLPPCVPTTSAWGVLIMTLGLSSIATILLRVRVKRSCVCVWLHPCSRVLDDLLSHKLQGWKVPTIQAR